MKFAHSIVALIAATVIKAQSPVFSNCAAGVTDLTVNSFSVSPYPGCRSQNMCITATGVLNSPITSGATLSLTGTIINPVYVDNQDLCALLAAQGTPCPVSTATTSITACVLIKNSAPVNAGMKMKITATNGNGIPLFCQGTTNFKFVICP